MRLTAGAKILVVYNANAGNKAQQDFTDLLDKKSLEYDFQFELYRMETEDCTRHINQQLTQYHPDFLMAAGGDGTINIVSAIAANHTLPMIILPCGSANGMARELDIPQDLNQAFDVIANFKRHKIDLLIINGKNCIHLADVGLNARIVKRFSEDSQRGLATYGRHLFKEIFLLRSRRFHIEYDGKHLRRKAVSVTFANASKYGTGAVINPTGTLNDGLFELCIVKPFPFIKIISIAWKMFFGSLKTSTYFEVISCRDAKITAKRTVLLQVDGEVIGKVKNINISIRPQALEVIMPAVN